MTFGKVCAIIGICLLSSVVYDVGIFLIQNEQSFIGLITIQICTIVQVVTLGNIWES